MDSLTLTLTQQTWQNMNCEVVYLSLIIYQKKSHNMKILINNNTSDGWRCYKHNYVLIITNRVCVCVSSSHTHGSVLMDRQIPHSSGTCSNVLVLWTRPSIYDYLWRQQTKVVRMRAVSGFTRVGWSARPVRPEGSDTHEATGACEDGLSARSKV